ncbi:MAG: large subunit ribosomal protein [Patescibacteria group bacterium]|nr:large subunit ribosomal protein [Patescibacteria group bacterium]
MQIHQIKRVHAHKKPKLLARGGKRGKTSGRGGKGQTARAGNKRRPAMRDIIKKLPKLRGHGKNRSKSVFDRGPFAVVNVGALNVFKAGEIVTRESLDAKGLIPQSFGRLPAVKILGSGDITVKVTVEGCDVSASAKAKIESAGGNVVVKEKKVSSKEEKKPKVKAKAPKKK